jgi:hypothetical protein
MSTPGASAGTARPVAVAAVVGPVGDGHIDKGRGRRHRGEHFASVDAPAIGSANRSCVRTGQILRRRLAHRGRQGHTRRRYELEGRPKTGPLGIVAAIAMSQLRTMLSSTEKCMFTPMDVATSP